MTGRLILVLGDQLTPQLSALRAGDPTRDRILMAEVMDEATYVRHHRKKIALAFSAMRHFAEDLRGDGWAVDYVGLDDPGNTGSLTGEVRRALTRHKLSQTLVTEPGEWRLVEQMLAWPETTLLSDRRFIADRHGFAHWANGRKTLRMEHFYRLMRRKTGLLMEGSEPAGGRWNLDADNRRRPPKDRIPPPPLRFYPDAITQAVIGMVQRRFPDHFGDLEPFWFAVTRQDAEAAFEHFLSTALRDFGAYQDAMLHDQPFMFHAVVSIYLNLGLLDPLALCAAAEAEWRAGRAPLNSVEGFIRQIIGWREFVRGVYWMAMPRYLEVNSLDAHRPLPEFYWTGETPMACVRTCVNQTRQEAYAHHIQRLMVTGNFALLAGISPAAVHEWYLAVYADAYEWVELPNTIGMSQFADGGLLASKPYAASGAYIDRMSDYCRTCAFDVKARSGPKACPFNLLYWRFIARNRDRWTANPRMAPIVSAWDRFPPERKVELLDGAERFLLTLA